MKHVVLNFRTAAQDVLLGHSSTLAFRLLAGAAAVVCLTALVSVGWQTALLLRDLSTTRASLAMTRADLSVAPTRVAPPTPALRQRIQGLNRVIRQLNAPWSDIFDALEKQAQAEVALVSIEPDASKGSVRIEAEAKRLEDLLEYARRLGQSSQFQHVTPVKHEINERDAARPFRMSIDATLSPRRTATGTHPS